MKFVVTLTELATLLQQENSAQGNYQNGWAYVAVTFLTFW